MASRQLQPLVLPQLGQAWQLPARCICTPHCMQYGRIGVTHRGGARGGRGAAGAGAGSSSSNVRADSIEGGSAGDVVALAGLDDRLLDARQRGLGALADGEDVRARPAPRACR